VLKTLPSPCCPPRAPLAQSPSLFFFSPIGSLEQALPLLLSLLPAWVKSCSPCCFAVLGAAALTWTAVLGAWSCCRWRGRMLPSSSCPSPCVLALKMCACCPGVSCWPKGACSCCPWRSYRVEMVMSCLSSSSSFFIPCCCPSRA